MSGNVWEWCWDWYSYTDNTTIWYEGYTSTDPKGPKTGNGRVVKGGAWNGGLSYLYTSYRYYYVGNTTSYIIGFRIVQNQ